MHYDLNISWTPSTSDEQLLQTLSYAASFGYDTVALNNYITQMPSNEPVAPFPDVAALASASDSSSPKPTKLPHVLSRVTFSFTDPTASKFRIPALIRGYDIVAVRPTTPEAFQNACLGVDAAIISLDLTQHFPHFRPKPCMAAVARGVRFEICYAQALAADARSRAIFIGNARGLIRATKGRGIIVSSGGRAASGPMALRATADVVNLLSMWGLPNEKGLEALRSVPRSVVVNEGIKRSGFRGVVDIVQTVPRDESASDGKQPSEQKEGKNSKRKNGEQGTQQSGSKRQAKKAKLASREAEGAK